MNLEQLVKISDTFSLTDIFNMMKKIIMQDTHVGTLAIYSSTIQAYSTENGYGIVAVRPIPLKQNQDPYTISVYVMDDRVFNPNQLLTILYTDLVFIENLQTDKTEPQKLRNQTLHSQMSGVIINDNPIKIVDQSDHIELTYNGSTYNLKKA